MALDLTRNHFELFELPVRFELEDAELSSRYRRLQQQLHPDRFAASSDTERRWSLQAASRVNDAYQTLRDPLRRAVYLLELNGISTDEETDTTMDPAFLMEQMEWREALEGAERSTDARSLLADLRKRLRASVGDTTSAFEGSVSQGDWPAARLVVRQWQFLDKLRRELRALDERLDDRPDAASPPRDDVATGVSTSRGSIDHDAG